MSDRVEIILCEMVPADSSLRYHLRPFAERIATAEERIHPWYGPCDGMGKDGGCAECEEVASWRWPEERPRIAAMQARLAQLEAENAELRCGCKPTPLGVIDVQMTPTDLVLENLARKIERLELALVENAQHFADHLRACHDSQLRSLKALPDLQSSLGEIARDIAARAQRDEGETV